MPVCHLHVGGFKTGSTAIQASLSACRGAVVDGGLLVPASGMNAGGNHAPLLRALAGATSGDERRDHAAGLAREVAAHPGCDIVLSCESLERHFRLFEPSPIIGRLKALGFHVRLLLYVREQVGRLNSRYAQKIKSFRGVHGIRDFAADALLTGEFHYTRWFDIVSRNAVELAPRAYVRAMADDVVRDFWGALDRLGPVGERANEAVGPTTLNAALHIHRRIIARGDKFNATHRNRAYRVLLRAAPRETPFWGLAPVEAETIRRRFLSDNDAFAMRVWKQPWAEVMGDPAPWPASTSIETLTPEAAALVVKVESEILAILADPALADRPDAAEGLEDRPKAKVLFEPEYFA